MQVLLAFAKRAAIAHQLLRCLTDFFLESGLARAQELDDYYERTGKLVGPLHGEPSTSLLHCFDNDVSD